jgi:hypothetical protein
LVESAPPQQINLAFDPMTDNASRMASAVAAAARGAPGLFNLPWTVPRPVAHGLDVTSAVPVHECTAVGRLTHERCRVTPTACGLHTRRPGHAALPCLSPIPRFRNSTMCVTMRPDIAAYWAGEHRRLRPYIANRTVGRCCL